MPRRDDLKKILIIGSGPIVIGQAAEFDYAGTQACLALKEEGYEVVLANSNPATIMTDTRIADKIYMEPLTLEYVARIIRRERPDAIVPGIGGQTGLNLAMQLDRKGILKECGVELLGTRIESIQRAEDRELFKEMCQSIGEPVIPSKIAYSQDEAREAAKEIGYPVVLRPAFTLGGTGGGFAYDEAELDEIAMNAFKLSPIHQVLVEKSVKGYKEIEYEVMRDADGKAITICGMENIDPVGVHTGDSMVVAPIMTLSPEEDQMLQRSAHKIIQTLGIEGGCNVQFALQPETSAYYLIEINPRVSRSSALASKASGYPIARVTAKVAVGMRLNEIHIAGQAADVEPSLDYVVSKLPRFPFDKFSNASTLLGTQMKATGEAMGIGANLCESLLKAVRSLEVDADHIYKPKFAVFSREELLNYLKDSRDDSLFAIAEALRRGVSVAEIHAVTKITAYFLEAFKRITDMEKELAIRTGDLELLRKAKELGFSDSCLARILDSSEAELFRRRHEAGILPVYPSVSTMRNPEPIPYFYSTYGRNDQGELSPVLRNLGETGAKAQAGAAQNAGKAKRRIIVLGAGPIRIGQGVEFDYSTVHAAMSIQKAGYEAIIINNNPETVSTDYSCADRLYFEPLTPEDVMNVIEIEKPEGVIATLGGQTAINLAEPLSARGVKLIGSDCEAIDRAEDRDAFEKVLADLGIDKPQGQAVTDIESGVAVAREIGYPVLVRPSFVLGGRAMQIVPDERQLRIYLQTAVDVDKKRPVLVDKYISGKEVEVDAVCDGVNVFVGGIMELVERSGVHSGDSISVYPSFSLSNAVKGRILEYAKKLGLGLGIVGLYNIQFIVSPDEKVYVIEVNPRSSRSVPFLSKASGYSLADIATDAILGRSLKEQGIFDIYPEEKKRYYVKVPVFSFNKIRGLDAYLSPEMKSTGEAIGYDDKLNRALYKALQAGGMRLQNYGTVFATIADADKEEALPLIRRFYKLGFNIQATEGTAKYLRKNGIRTHSLHKLSEGSQEIAEAINAGYIAYIINTGSQSSLGPSADGREIRRLAIEHNTQIFTALDTVRVLLDVLEEMTIGVSTIDA